MRLLAARVRDYRLHRDLALEFDPRFTVIAGPNQSGKSTLAEALHRALFLPVRTGGELQKGMRSEPFLSEPEVELAFEAAGERWELRKRFAANRGSVVLRDAAGRSLQGDEAEERLAELIGTAAVARNRAAADQLKERWGHLWVWQGSASGNPLALSSQAYDHDRLVERLQAGADLGVSSELDLAVQEEIQARWSAVFTAGGSNRAPQVRKGSPLQLARAATSKAEQELAVIEARVAGRSQEEQALQQAIERLADICRELPQQRRQRQHLQQRLARSAELQTQIDGQQPMLEGVLKDLAGLEQDRLQLRQEGQRLETLTAAQAPGQARMQALRDRQPPLEAVLAQLQSQLQIQQQVSAEASGEARTIETQLRRQRLLQEQERIGTQLRHLERLREAFRQRQAELAALPAIDAAGVERLRVLEAALQAARVRAESLSAGIEVIRAGQPLLLNGEPLETGTSRLLSQPALLQVGEEVELRLLPGGGTSTAAAARALEQARQALAQELEALGLPSLEMAAQAERRRSTLLAEQQQLKEQARIQGDDASLRQRLAVIGQELQVLPPHPDDGEALALDSGPSVVPGRAPAEQTMPAAGLPEPAWPEPTDQDPVVAAQVTPEPLQRRIEALERDLGEARSRRDQAQAALQALQGQQQQASQELESLRQAIQQLERELQQQQNQLLEARTRRDALLERHGSEPALDAGITVLVERRERLQAALTALRSELAALDPAGLKAEDQSLAQRIAALEAQEQDAREARIRGEERLYGDGSTDLQAEREQKQAELETRQQDQERLEKEAAMLTLLRQLLDEEQNAMGSQYAAPMLSRIGRYLAQVFPDAPEVRLGYDARSGFQGLEWRRGQEAAFPFEQLSTGAREQFAAALRVSMAEVLAEAYDGSLPVLFDDAFANSDPERQRGVHRMLAAAADQGLQVILLSCDPERSQTISGARQIRLGA
ncbi:MAG: AAA family ATPase [Cyanobacteriota bacterium]|nr:AAA family ATPase [Cyanobacteriota bacterium]